MTDSILENIDGASQSHMNKVISIFKSFILRFDEEDRKEFGDFLAILEGTYRISRKAIDNNFVSVITNGMDVLNYIHNSQLQLFRLGEKNFEKSNYNLSLESLNKLAFKYKHITKNEYLFCYIGLLSYFINANESLKNIAVSISQVHKSLFPTINYKRAKEYFKLNGDFNVLEPIRLSKDVIAQHISLDEIT